MQDRDESERILKSLQGSFDELAKQPMTEGAVSRTIAVLPKEGEIVKLRGLDFLVTYVNDLEGKLRLEISNAAYQANGAEHSEQSGGLTLRLIRMVNSLGNIIVDSFGKGYIAENDLNQANDYLDEVIPLLPPS